MAPNQAGRVEAVPSGRVKRQLRSIISLGGLLPVEPEAELLSEPVSGGGVQTPFWHVPKEHGAPSNFWGFEQVPMFTSHVPATWQSSLAEQTIGTPAHLPTLQASVSVQGFSSSQGKLSTLAGLEQAPVEGSQVGFSWH